MESGLKSPRPSSKCFAAAKAPVHWERQVVGTESVEPGGLLVSDEALASIARRGIALKGPLAIPIGAGHVSLNLSPRKPFSFMQTSGPAAALAGPKTRYDNVDVVVVRENTEGEYSGLEHEVVPAVVESLKVIRRTESMRIAEFAFYYAATENRRKVSAIHKAKIMKKSDGLSELLPGSGEEISSASIRGGHCGQLLHAVGRSSPTLRRDGVTQPLRRHRQRSLRGPDRRAGPPPSGNIGESAAIFESVHGTAPDIAGQGRARPTPTALLLSACMRLRHLGEIDLADALQAELELEALKREGVRGRASLPKTSARPEGTLATAD